MARVTLPSNGTGSGCYGLEFADGTKTPKARPGSSIEIDDSKYRAIRQGAAGKNGLITSTGYSFGTKGGRRCPCSPNTSWNVWTKICPRCGGPTKPE
jgi:hypothetical protein